MSNLNMSGFLHTAAEFLAGPSGEKLWHKNHQKPICRSYKLLSCRDPKLLCPPDHNKMETYRSICELCSHSAMCTRTLPRVSYCRVWLFNGFRMEEMWIVDYALPVQVARKRRAQSKIEKELMDSLMSRLPLK